MGKFAQFVIGPAGSGKSTYCSVMKEHCNSIRRSVHIVNLDPAAEVFNYPVSIDVKDLITLEDVMEELKLGPNGGLVYCMEFLIDHIDEWLGEELEGYGEDDYLIFDCPGQIELYSHIPCLKQFLEYLQRDGWTVCAVYCMDCHFMTDASKFIAGCFQALSAMVTLELPHVNVLTKMDICPAKDQIKDMVYPDAYELMCRLQEVTGQQFRNLNQQVTQLLEEYGTVGFQPLDITDENSIAEVLAQIDTGIQYGEDMDVKIRDFDEPEDEHEDNNGSYDMD
eukprot:TRINITY_DN41513_c0_g1_i1.p1 TRINITY_DN41513_c0_g1~~TRINITY_DN41513_c0_g1_i1.p1  ORF type:complete len:280 (-),score=42.93 TRINITY_DN41513_c0_g1_i1:303-1142(-)